MREKASVVQAPLLKECYVNLKCRVIDRNLVSAYDMFILEVQKAWIRPTAEKPHMLHHCGKGTFVIDGATRTLPSKKKEGVAQEILLNEKITIQKSYKNVGSIHKKSISQE